MKNECVSLYKLEGTIIARIYEPGHGYHKQKFLWYTIKEVINMLRHEYNCKVSREVIKEVYR